jgi:DNA repair protein SbcC/Rad50
MRLRRLSLAEFRLFPELELRFDDGLVLIEGPNGSGKSTILEAVTWALFGAGAARRSEASLRRAGAPPRSGTRAELHFEIDGRSYRVWRGIEPEGASLEDGDGIALAAGAEQVSRAVAGLLGTGREGFMHACCTGRRELHQLA